MRILVVLALTAALVWAGFELFGKDAPPVHGSSTEMAGADGGSATEPLQGGVGGEVEAPSNQSVVPVEVPVDATPAVDVNPFDRPAVALGVSERASIDGGGRLAHGRFDEVLGAFDAGELELPVAREEVVRCLIEALAGRTDMANDQAAVLFERGLLGERDVVLLQAALGKGAPPRAGGSIDALDLGAELAVVLRSAEQHAARGELPAAARLVTRYFEADLDAPWTTTPTDLEAAVALMRDIHRRYRWDPRVEWPHVELTVEAGEGLTNVRQRALALRPGVPLSTGLIARANRLSGSTIHPGQVLRIPTEPVTVLVDVSKKWLLYRIGPDVVEAWPVGTGAEGKETMLGEFVVGLKQTDPTWWPRNKEPVPFGHPDNPLGTRWLGWRVPGTENDTSFGFHGTWQPDSIGQAASEGCVRMRNEDVEVLFEILPQDSRFVVRS
jgi:lipoprotein-anchoring transpeptidase ErfK/SrfK